jgi:hypothetical protein
MLDDKFLIGKLEASHYVQLVALQLADGGAGLCPTSCSQISRAALGLLKCKLRHAILVHVEASLKHIHHGLCRAGLIIDSCRRCCNCEAQRRDRIYCRVYRRVL